MNEGIAYNKITRPINVLLADDDQDDCFFFRDALSKLTIPTSFSTVSDGERLMKHLAVNKLPDVLFLDFNMPRKNGAECLREIKSISKFKALPVVMYSTSLHEAITDDLYEEGAHCYLRKPGLVELRLVLKHIMTMLAEGTFTRPPRNEFVFSLNK